MIKTNEKFEYVSVLMDDEPTEEMLDKLLSDEEAIQKWAEYHTIRDYMNPSVHAATEVSFLKEERFQHELAQISLMHQAAQIQKMPERKAANHSFKMFALVAGVAAVAVLSWQIVPKISHKPEVPVAAEKMQPSSQPETVRVGNTSATRVEPVVPNAAQSTELEKQKAVRTESRQPQAQQTQTIVQ